MFAFVAFDLVFQYLVKRRDWLGGGYDVGHVDPVLASECAVYNVS